MFKLLSELNIDKKDYKDYKDLALLPGFNIPNIINEKTINKKIDNINAIDEKTFIKFFNYINTSKNNYTKKRKSSSRQKNKSKKIK